jgi:hypothetical protein
LKLYDVPRYTYFTIKGDSSKEVFYLDHLDGMYSLCFTEDNKVVSIAYGVEVELVK